MNTASMARKFIVLQQQAVNSSFDAMGLFQDQVEQSNRILVKKMGMGDKAHHLLDQWQMVFKKGRGDTRKLVAAGFANMEGYLAEVAPKEPTETK